MLNTTLTQVDNAYDEFGGRVVVDLGCGTVCIQLASNCLMLKVIAAAM